MILPPTSKSEMKAFRDGKLYALNAIWRFIQGGGGSGRVLTYDYLDVPHVDGLDNGAQGLANYILNMGQLLSAAPKECICHVKSFDGYYGSSHTEPCRKYLEALAALGVSCST